MQNRSQLDPSGYVAMTHHELTRGSAPAFTTLELREPADTRVYDASGAVKADGEKVRLELLPTEALEEIAKVLTFGAKKYDDNNWRKGFKWLRVIGATFRHLYAWVRGESKDPETGISHLAHAGCNILFLITFEKTGTGTDDRIARQAKA
jgi:hypothetical protein